MSEVVEILYHGSHAIVEGRKTGRGNDRMNSSALDELLSFTGEGGGGNKIYSVMVQPFGEMYSNLVIAKKTHYFSLQEVNLLDRASEQH